MIRLTEAKMLSKLDYYVYVFDYLFMYKLLKDKNLNTKYLYYCINCHRGRQDFELAGQVEAQFSVKRESTVISGYYEVCLCLT
jgi:hypothetical protein